MRSRHLHQVTSGDTGNELERWPIVLRDAVAYHEVVAVADALPAPAPAMAELA
ncbi:hypothetical protein [Streptomyces wuyuanensis]|uniref:hypothetical protein n=1 Tax=Streptomyces wuyuanensis TaxID=1196353 RepID=UPI0037204CAD